jgi:hypothetical protein
MEGGQASKSDPQLSKGPKGQAPVSKSRISFRFGKRNTTGLQFLAIGGLFIFLLGGVLYKSLKILCAIFAKI